MMIWGLRSALLTQTVGSHTLRWSARDLVTLAKELRFLAVEARKNIFACHEGDDVMVANPVTSFGGNGECTGSMYLWPTVLGGAVVAPLGRTERTSATMYSMWPPATVPSGYTNGPLSLFNERMVCQMEDGG
jgi:hypothetical protein